MGSQQQSWTSAEDRFGRRLKVERERRGLTQADVARKLEERGLKLHATAIAKMEQRDASRPRVIRLGEAQAIADIFGMSVDEMLSDAEVEMERLARDVMALNARADALRAQTADVFQRLRVIAPDLREIQSNASPSLQASRKQIIRTLAAVYEVEEERRRAAENLLRETLKGVDATPPSLQGVAEKLVSSPDVDDSILATLTQSAAADAHQAHQTPELSPQLQERLNLLAHAHSSSTNDKKDLSDELINYIDDGLSEDLRKRVADHLKTCKACQAEEAKRRRH